MWTFNACSNTGRIAATEPDGTQHSVARGDMNTLAGHTLLNAMVRDLTKAAEPVAFGIFANIPGEGWVLQFPNYPKREDAERMCGVFAAGTELEVRPLYA